MRTTKYTVILTEPERAQLRTLIGQGAAPARQLAHARILLKANQGEGGAGWTDTAIAGAVEVHPATVGRVRRAYVEAGLEAALERKAPTRVYPRRLDGDGEAHLIALACARPMAAPAGPCACWPMNWCGWRSLTPSRMRRSDGP